jgi:hypothetical protein
MNSKRNMASIPVVAMTAVIGCACSSHTPIVKNTPPAEAVSESPPVLFRLEGVDQTIVVRSVAGEPAYSLESNDGAVLVPNMTLGELRAAHPDLYKRVIMMHADKAWAGMPTNSR